jgi:hypothetical protein
VGPVRHLLRRACSRVDAQLGFGESARLKYEALPRGQFINTFISVKKLP